MRVTSELLMQPLALDAWHRLRPRGRIFGNSGAPMQRVSDVIHTSKGKVLTPSAARSPALVDGLGKDITAEDVKSLVHGSKQRLGPSDRPASWTSEKTRYTERTRSTLNRLS